MDLTDSQWEIVEPLLPKPRRRPDRRGRPWRDARQVLHGILWILRTGAPWKDMPERYPPYRTCHRRFQQWVRDGTFEAVLHRLAEDCRPLRRYKRRWKVERPFAWLQNSRRLVIRYEYHADNFLGMLHLGCILILLRRS